MVANFSRSIGVLATIGALTVAPGSSQRASFPANASRTINLSTSKQLIEPVPGAPQTLNSLPMTVAVSPDGRYLAVVNAGFGTFPSQYEQSIALVEIKSGNVTDFPEPRTDSNLPQTLYSSLAFSSDGTLLYAAFDSLTAPQGGGQNQTGNAIAVYSVKDGKLLPQRLLPVPLQPLASGKAQNKIGATIPNGMAIPYPAAIAVRKAPGGGDELVVADNLSDDVLLMSASSGEVLHRFDLSQGNVVPATYPIAVTLNRAGSRAYVALWNGSAIAELDLASGKVVAKLNLLPPQEPTSPSSHPAAFAWSPDEKTLFVALANRDAVAAVRVGSNELKLETIYDTRLPGQTYFGAMPDAVAVSKDGKRLFAANTGSDAVAVFDLDHKENAKPSAFVPTEWYPTALAVSGDKLYVATGKGKGTGPNNMPQPNVPGMKRSGSSTYIATMLQGSLAAIDLTKIDRQREQLTRTVVATNMTRAAHDTIPFKGGTNPIKHVIYIIKENRTYDQVFGDLGVGNGMASLTMFGEETTPNEHKLARQFGVLDNFYDSGEVSGDGHVWSNAAISSDYTEKTWQQSYRGRERVYDFEGEVEDGYPLKEGISDVNEPNSSYIWTNLARNGKSLYHFGEFISTEFCSNPDMTPKGSSPLEGTPEPQPVQCGSRGDIRQGEAIPQNYGGGASPYPWPIPLIKQNIATKPELVGHFDANYPDFELSFPDQLRVEEFLTHFREWVSERQMGHDEMPQFIQLRLPNDHTAGTTPGMPTPKASVADNDLAVGRAVEAISHSPYWNDTAFFILEDDAQAGADHVDAHRSIALVVSKYSPRVEKPLVDSTFYTTVSVLRTIEELLGVPPMNNNDAFAPAIGTLFSGAGDQPPYQADYRNRDNKLIYQANGSKAPGAAASSKMDFTHEDRADPRVLNVILWRDVMGNKPLPAMLKRAVPRDKDDD